MHNFFEGHNPPLYFFSTPFLSSPPFFEIFPTPLLKITPLPLQQKCFCNPTPQVLIELKSERKNADFRF